MTVIAKAWIGRCHVKRPGKGNRRRRGSAPTTLSLVLGSAALHTDISEATPGQRPVVVDVAGRRIDLDPGEAIRLRDAAAACAGRSSTARDLSLLLDRALSRHRVIALHRAEAHTLAQLARQEGLSGLVRAIEAPAA